jgi:Ni,Fe-hydrogenase I cytochrome b subunit
MPVFFSAHGIFALRLDAFRSILNSLRMVRYTLPNTGLFLLAFLLINEGMNFLWRTPQQASWWMLVGIAGHAFVSTALLAASFIYYHDINAWLTVVFEQLQRKTSSAKV